MHARIDFASGLRIDAWELGVGPVDKGRLIVDITREDQVITRRNALKMVGGFAAGGALALVGCQQEASTGAEQAPPAPSAPEAAPEAAPEPAPTDAEAKPSADAGGAGGAVECDTSGIDEPSKSMRNTLKYVEKTPEEGKICSGCAQWKAPEGDSACGGCNLFTGPVNPNGYCISYAPKAG